MIEPSQIRLPFASISGKVVEADFASGAVRSDGGVLLLRALESQMGLIARMVDALRDRRHPSYIDHTLLDLVKQRVFQIACGYEDAVDCDDLRHDPGVKAACDRLPLSGPDLGEANPRYLVTNLQSNRDGFIYDRIYCARGRTEGFIKDHKTFLHSDRTSCHKFEANQFRLFLHSAAYALLHALRSQGLKGTAWTKPQVNTIQNRFLKIGARVIESARRIRFHFPTSYPLKNVLVSIITRLETNTQ